MLLIGGPEHGTERELKPGDDSLAVIVPGPDNVLRSFRYVVRGVQAETRPNVFYKRNILVDSQMPVEVASQALAAVLLQRFADELVRQFMEGGELVDENDSLDTSE